jgi:hypothetical protein
MFQGDVTAARTNARAACSKLARAMTARPAALLFPGTVSKRTSASSRAPIARSTGSGSASRAAAILDHSCAPRGSAGRFAAIAAGRRKIAGSEQKTGSLCRCVDGTADPSWSTVDSVGFVITGVADVTVTEGTIASLIPGLGWLAKAAPAILGNKVKISVAHERVVAHLPHGSA